MTKFFDAVVFDCDGVLVDSEPLMMKVDQRVFADMGWNVELADLAEIFMGSSQAFFHAEVERRVGRTLEPNWADLYSAWYEDVFARELREIPGISAVFDALELPFAVASNSSHHRIRSSLTTVGLLDRVDGRICSADDVPNGKPSPDVYLRAAELLGVDPQRCMAIEDSEPGTQAARSAGMHVLAYRTSLTPKSWFSHPDLTVFGSMDAVPELVQGLTNNGPPVSSGS